MFKVKRDACPILINTYSATVVSTLAYCATQTVISFSEAAFNGQRSWEEIHADMKNAKAVQLVFSRHVRRTFIPGVSDFHKTYGEWLDGIVKFINDYWDDLYRDPDREERVKNILYGQANLNMFHFEFIRKEDNKKSTHVNVRLRDNNGTPLDIQAVEIELGESEVIDFSDIPDYPVFGEIKTIDTFLSQYPKVIDIFFTRFEADFPTSSDTQFTHLRYDT